MFRCQHFCNSLIIATQKTDNTLHLNQQKRKRWFPVHYSDVIMSVMASQITGVSIVSSNFGSGADQGKHQSFASLALWGEFTCDQWISCTKGQQRGKCFHLMTFAISRTLGSDRVNPAVSLMLAVQGHLNRTNHSIWRYVNYISMP